MGDLGEYTSAAPDSALPCSSNASPTCNDVPIIRTSFPERQSRKVRVFIIAGEGTRQVMFVLLLLEVVILVYRV